MAGCQINLIDLNFHLQKCLEIFDKNSADKIQPKNYKGVNPTCLMPIRVKGNLFCFAFASKKPDFIIIMINNAFGATVMNFSAKNKDQWQI